MVEETKDGTFVVPTRFGSVFFPKSKVEITLMPEYEVKYHLTRYNAQVVASKNVVEDTIVPSKIVNKKKEKIVQLPVSSDDELILLKDTAHKSSKKKGKHSASKKKEGKHHSRHSSGQTIEDLAKVPIPPKKHSHKKREKTKHRGVADPTTPKKKSHKKNKKVKSPVPSISEASTSTTATLVNEGQDTPIREDDGFEISSPIQPVHNNDKEKVVKDPVPCNTETIVHPPVVSIVATQPVVSKIVSKEPVAPRNILQKKNEKIVKKSPFEFSFVKPKESQYEKLLDSRPMTLNKLRAPFKIPRIVRPPEPEPEPSQTTELSPPTSTSDQENHHEVDPDIERMDQEAADFLVKELTQSTFVTSVPIESTPVISIPEPNDFISQYLEYVEQNIGGNMDTSSPAHGNDDVDMNIIAEAETTTPAHEDDTDMIDTNGNAADEALATSPVSEEEDTQMNEEQDIQMNEERDTERNEEQDNEMIESDEDSADFESQSPVKPVPRDDDDDQDILNLFADDYDDF